MIGTSVTLNVMIGTMLLGATAGVIGTFAVLRRQALVGDMLSHAALPGICLAFVIMQHRNILGLSLGALATGLLGIAAVSFITRTTRTKQDAAIGIVLSTFFGAGVVLLTIIQQAGSGNQAGLDRFLFGEVVGMRASDIHLLIGTATLCLLVVVAFYKEFQLIAFDADFAAAQGWPTFAVDLAMMGTLAVVTVVGLPICGVILMAAMIILPATAARFWTNRLERLLVIAAAVGSTAGMVGTLLASPWPSRWLGSEGATGFLADGVPPGPLIVLTAAAIFVASLLFAPQRGVVARAIGEARLRMRISREHLLRALYELSEPRLPERPWIDRQELLAHRRWSGRMAPWWLRRAESRGLVRRVGGKLQLTPAGLAEAAEVTRAHRLWELFLVDSAGIAADHVDRDADDVEHMLPRPLLGQLERRLAAAGRLPTVSSTVPESPHDIGAG